MLVRRLVPSEDNTNVKVIQLESASNANHVGRINVQMNKGCIPISVNTVNIRQPHCNVPSNLESSQRSSFRLVRQLSQARSFCILGNDGMSTESKHVNDMRRRSQALHGHCINSVMLKVSIFKLVLKPVAGGSKKYQILTKLNQDQQTRIKNTYLSVLSTTVSRSELRW